MNIDEETVNLLSELYLAVQPVDTHPINEARQCLKLLFTEIHDLKTKVHSVFESSTLENMSVGIQDAISHADKIQHILSTHNAGSFNSELTERIATLDQVLKALLLKLKV